MTPSSSTFFQMSQFSPQIFHTHCIVFFFAEGGYIKKEAQYSPAFCGKHPGTSEKKCTHPRELRSSSSSPATPAELQRPAESTFLIAEGSQDVGYAAKPSASKQSRCIDFIESPSAIPSTEKEEEEQIRHHQPASQQPEGKSAIAKNLSNPEQGPIAGERQGSQPSADR